MITRDGDRYRVQGPLTMSNITAVLEEGLRLFEGDSVVVDFAGAEEVDSSAVSLMLEWLRDARRRNRRVQFVNLPANLTSLAKLYDALELVQ